MATAKRAKAGWGTITFRVLALAGIAGGLLWFFFGTFASGMSVAGTGYAAKTACSCRFLAGRELGSCDDDLGGGFAMVWLSEDADEQSVTATVPGLASTTATFKDGPGCVLESWDS